MTVIFPILRDGDVTDELSILGKGVGRLQEVPVGLPLASVMMLATLNCPRPTVLHI